MTVAKDHGLGAECASLQVVYPTHVLDIITISITIIVIIRRRNMHLVLAFLQTWWFLILL